MLSDIPAQSQQKSARIGHEIICPKTATETPEQIQNSYKIPMTQE